MLGLGVAAALLGSAYAQYSSSLPTVDLGYEIHRASSFNDTGRFYNFSNIRYAAPPIGNLRFAPPEAPATNRSAVNDGSVGKICPQASPAWSAVARQVLTDLFLGKPINETDQTVPHINSSSPLPPQDPRTDEDCLFLDVFVPEQILHTAGQGYGAPVLVWIYGGGYVGGDKFENPAGLLAASGNVSDGKVIFVALNYRLGALGFSSGPSFNAEGGVSNLAFYDQRFALEWVQKNIHLFGGDPNRVTVMGESAGGGSIMHQITAYGGLNGPAPFQQAIPQSPGWIPIISNLQQENTYQQLLNLTNTTSLAELRNLSSSAILRANYLAVANAAYGSYAYGPVVDGVFAPLEPGQLLALGRFDKSIRVMAGHNADEGEYFVPPAITSSDAFKFYFRTTLPYTPAQSIDYITSTLYPEVFDGTYPYRTQRERAVLSTSESIFTCNTHYLSTAFGNKTYSYLFAVPPAWHGLDVEYTFYDGGAVTSFPYDVTNATVALALQDLITSFVVDGRPRAEGVMEFRMYGEEARVLELNATGFEEVRDANANERCRWWQKALYN